jgi:hypothetical protein
MKRQTLTGKKYFYSRGQSARARKMTKVQAEAFYRIDAAADYARIAFDAGFRGLSAQ